MRKSRKQLLCGMLVCALAATTVFSTSPVTKAESIEVVSDATQNNAATLTIHAKGTGLTVHAWNSEGDITAWPGKAMTDDGNGWCSISFEENVGGLLIVKDGNNKLTPDDVTDKTSGEWWFADGVWYDKNPDGGSDATATPSADPTPTPDVTPSATPESAGEITIESITPADNSKLEAGKEQTIEVKAKSTIYDGLLYYKFEVACDGKFVGDRYYSKNNTYKFTPESGKSYTVSIFVQAHDEENTYKKVMYTYTTSGEATTPSTTAPTASDEPGKETASPEPGKGTPTPTPSTTPKVTGTPTGTPNGGKNTPVPTQTPSSGGSNGTATQAPTGTFAPDNSANIPLQDVSNIDVKFSVSKTSPMTLGSSVELEAIASNGTGNYTYRFRAKKSTEAQAKVIRDYSTSSTCIWTPSAKGTYTLYVDVKDGSNSTAVTKTITKYKVNGLTLSASTSKKSPQKKNTKVKITAKTTYASGSVKYKFVIKLNGKTVKTRAYKKTKTYTWKPTKKGTYTIYVYAKDSKSTVVKKATFKIK